MMRMHHIIMRLTTGPDRLGRVQYNIVRGDNDYGDTDIWDEEM